MAVLGIDTATPATAVALLLDDGGTVVERRDDPAPGERPGHAARVLELVEAVLAEAAVDWPAVTRLGVGVGPGGFTGLRIGIATARALAQARGLEVVPVGTLRALAAGAGDDAPTWAVLDARRGEAFAALHAEGGAEVLPPAALAPDALHGAVARMGGGRAVGDGAVRFREQLERAGATVPRDGSPVHRVSAAPICRLAAAGMPVDRDALVPHYVRDPDAKPPAR